MIWGVLGEALVARGDEAVAYPFTLLAQRRDALATPLRVETDRPVPQCRGVGLHQAFRLDADQA